MLCAFTKHPRRAVRASSSALSSLVATAVLMVASSLLFLTEPADAATARGSLVCDSSTLVTGVRSRTASCSFSLEGGEGAAADLFHMDEFAFYGLDGDEAPKVVLVPIKSKRDTLEGGSQETIWKGSNSDDTSYGFSTLVQGSDDGGLLSGNINTEEATYLVSQMPSTGTIQVRETLWENAKGLSPRDSDAELDGTPELDGT